MNKAKKKQQTIRQKLIAAIAMLMVSAIMVVSSSYAWFTLSTSPEVTGIETSIGANGNLEMALNNGGTITSNVGDSMVVTGKTAQEYNITWGNLVDLSNGYGLDMVKLMPSRLAFLNGALQQGLLEVPTYGADGRVEALEGVLQGIYANGSVPAGDGNGVRLFGTSAGMSDEALALRSSKQNFRTYMDAAMGKASNTLTENGGNLADMAITHGLDDTATFTRVQVESLNNVVLALESAANYIETALKYAVKAAAAAGEGGNTFSIEGKSLEEVIAAFATVTGADIAYLDTYVTDLNELKAAVAAAKTVMTDALEDTAKTTFAWGDFSAAINAMMNSSLITVNGMTIQQVKDAPGDLANKYMTDREIKMNVPTGAGVFADIADFTGDYKAPITIPRISYQEINLENVPATMYADTTLDQAHSEVISAAMESITAFEGTGTASLSDLYAYAIDLAFRTNAADSDLLLQTDAADRIYDDNSLETTQGGGSYMEFTLATGFKLETAKALMGCIRVVFMSTNNGSTSASAPTIYKVAVLDVDSLTTSGGKVKVPLKLVDYTIENNELVITEVNGKPSFATEATIKALSQNVQENLTALVYLDGNKVDNSMVANGEFSLTGHLNLQFASSAELKPMEYTDLHIPEENAGNP